MAGDTNHNRPSGRGISATDGHAVAVLVGRIRSGDASELSRGLSHGNVVDEIQAGPPASRPVMTLKSAVVFTWGNGSAGTANPRAEQRGSHPSPGRHSTSRPAGTDARTLSLWAS